MHRPTALLTAIVSGLVATAATASPARADEPVEQHLSVTNGPFELCGLASVTYAEETDLRLVSRPSGPDGDWKFTAFTRGWYAFTNGDTGRTVTATYRKADRDLRVLESDGGTRTLRVMNNRSEVWTNDEGDRLDLVHGPIAFTVTVSYAGTPSDPMDDFWVGDPSEETVHGDWSLDDTFCDVLVANLT